MGSLRSREWYAKGDATATAVSPPVAAASTTATDGDGGESSAEAPQLTPEELARAAAALRQAQARMSGARVQFRLAVIAAAEAALRDAQTKLDRVKAAANNPSFRALAEKTLRDAQANLQQLPVTVKPEDVAAANADVVQAQARLQAAKAGPDPQTISAAQNQLAEAQANYQKIAADASLAKTTAEQRVSSAAEGVRTAQKSYSDAYWQNQQAQTGRDPLTGKGFGDEGRDPDTEKRRYADLFAAADQQLKAAAARLTAAQAAFEQAKAQEVKDVAAAQTAVDAAQAQLNQLPQAPDAAAIAQAQTQLDQARARAAKLQQDLAAANAASADAQKRVADAQAQLQKLQSNAVTPEVAAAQTQVDQAKTKLAQARAGGLGRGGWMWPTFGAITSGFGLRDFSVGRYHNGVDTANASGTPIGAARDGVVIEAGWCAGYGYCVKLRHSGGFTTEYGHMAGPPPVKVGQTVSAGTIIGAMGTTYDAAGGGFSTGVHLHFTIRRYGAAVDPLLYLP